MKDLHIRIHGRVQGVFYRQWTITEASAKGLSGWVRNCTDGTVEAWFSGEEQSVDEMFMMCRKGSPASFVASIDILPPEKSGLPEVQEGVFRKEKTC
ncbi:MAG: acylphosphatase [Alphaproteobacteria bacterium]|nr:acylphosphatase [Alphaproteobacteria bacterium]